MLFFRILKNIPWDSSNIYDNIDDIWSQWSGLFKQVLDEHAPVKRVQLRDNQLPWISQKQICTVYVIDFIRYIFVHQQT